MDGDIIEGFDKWVAEAFGNWRRLNFSFIWLHVFFRELDKKLIVLKNNARVKVKVI